jgi:hypothetical protein
LLELLEANDELHDTFSKGFVEPLLRVCLNYTIVGGLFTAV